MGTGVSPGEDTRYTSVVVLHRYLRPSWSAFAPSRSSAPGERNDEAGDYDLPGAGDQGAPANRYKVQIATGLMRKALAELAV